MKHLYAMLSVMSNMFKIIRPYTIVKTVDNKTYFVTSLNEETRRLKGLLLPISKEQLYRHELDISSNLKSFEIIPYNMSLLKNFELPFSLFKKAVNIEQKQSSYSLFKIYTLQWVKENILDSEHGKEFTEKFFNKIKNRIFKDFIFSDHLNMILSLMKKSIVLQTEDVFTNSLSKPKLFHASFTNFVFESDYLLTETKLKAIKSPHVFVSSVINESNPVFLNINYSNLSQNFSFGIIAHSVEHNKKISIKYSSQESMFFINGEKASEYKLQANSSIEILYLPSQNLVSFADSSKDRKVIISVDLAQKLKCSFFVLVYPDSEFEYECDLTPKTNCFIYHQNTKFANINKDVQVISLLFQKDYTEELEGIIHYSREFKEMKYKQKDLLKLDQRKQFPLAFTLTKFKSLPETDLFMAQYPNSYFYSLLSNICSSTNQLNQYLQIHDISGTFSLIQPEKAIIENSDSIPAFNIQKYHNLPSEILNSYIDEACEFYKREIMTLFAVFNRINQMNYLLLNEKAISESVNRNELERFFSSRIFAGTFMNMINNHNSSDKVSFTIDQQKGLDYRNGINNVVSNSMIAQFSESYLRNPNSFRNKTTPFRIKYKGERGIDAGGLMRDFFTELITDIKTPRVGFFIQTPNGRNHEGNYQDCIVPAPLPEISNSERYYRSIGALIAIAIRTEMRQPDLVFPDFFWSFIISGKLKIDDIYEIDKSYKSVTTNLLLSANEMTDEEFENLMSSTTICNLKGNPITIDVGNRRHSSSIRLSKSNCARFIAICDEFRLNELLNPLSNIREGFWQNLAIELPPFVTASLLEIMACGDRIISIDALRSAVQFSGVPNTQINYFWQVVARMNNEERKKLIHFSTGLNSLSSRGLKIDFLGGGQLDRLPTASTCFFSLHLPQYSSADRMYNAFILAINETGTFENS